MNAGELNDFARLEGIALVTGGTGGIGSAACRLLAARGAAVVFTSRSPERAKVLAAELDADSGGTATAHHVDLTDDESVAAMVNSLIDEHGSIHTLVHAAGPLVRQQHLSTIPPTIYRDHLTAEAGAFFAIAHACLPTLRTARGSIVAVTTAATSRYPVRDGLSSGTKAAIEAVVRGLAVEEGRYGVRANCVGPGMLTDGMATQLIKSGDLDDQALDAARSRIPLRRFGTAADIAEAVCFLASPRAAFITGQKLDIDGGFTA